LIDATQHVIIEEEQQEIINQLIESTLLNDEDGDNFVKMFDKVHTGFFSRLNEKWTGLTPSEIRLITLSRLKLDNKKMARMLGVSSGAIRQVKSRLRRKVEVETKESLNEIIATV
jgi:DNA-binding CsgD family transcriptional regulator